MNFFVKKTKKKTDLFVKRYMNFWATTTATSKSKPKWAFRYLNKKWSYRPLRRSQAY